MRFIFLGTGTSAGVPSIGCRCAVCTSADPRDRRRRTSACLCFTDASGQERTILIDAGPDLREQALGAGLDRLDAILFTHNHVDHTFGLDEVRRFNVVMGGPIDIYAEPRTLEHLRRVYRHIFDSTSNVQPSFVASLIAHQIDGQAPLDLFGLRITPVRLLHGRLPILGYRIEPGEGPDAVRSPLFPLAYCTDVSAIPPESWSKLDGVRTLVLDALRPRHHPTHFTIDQAVRTAQRVNPEQTWLVHMSHEVAHEQTEMTLPSGIRLAYDGLALE